MLFEQHALRGLTWAGTTIVATE